nr:RNA-directed DNA polymerase, eukaryota, reverse transcriptase zinc-binding domain protein [Tanacetum cinerariifolium]
MSRAIASQSFSLEQSWNFETTVSYEAMHSGSDFKSPGGVMVGQRSSRLRAWDDIILKLRARLSKWKVKTLSIGGRLTLLKLVLGASPIYNMSIYKVLASKKHGGLGVSSYFALNRALLSKWVWRFVSQDDSLWFKTIRALYEKGFDLRSHCKKRIGNGINSSFWFDCWIGDSPFHDKFPRLFALELNKEVSVAAKLNVPIDYSFHRRPRGGIEKQQMTDLLTLLDATILSNSGDRWICDLSSDGIFK